jgi:hypothetical protein
LGDNSEFYATITAIEDHSHYMLYILDTPVFSDVYAVYKCTVNIAEGDYSYAGGYNS